MKSLIKMVVIKTTGGLAKLVAQSFQSRNYGLTVFVFHDVTSAPSRFALQHNLSLSPTTFLHHILWIKRNFVVIHPSDLIQNESLPFNAAIITFDDGFLGAFENGLDLLSKQELPCIIFLNMRAVIERKPILSAVACYLSQYVPEFTDFANSVGLAPPFHLTLNPKLMKMFENRYGLIDLEAVLDFQGSFADLVTVKKWDNVELVVFGNHLYDHWNATALDIEEFDEQYKMNEKALLQLANSVDLFSFTNGQPGSCYSQLFVKRLEQLGAKKIFSSAGCLNRDHHQYLLDRLSLVEDDKDEDFLWFQMARGVVNTRLTLQKITKPHHQGRVS